MSAGIHQALAFVKTIENKLYPRRDSKFFEDFLQIVSNDRMLARGCSQRQVALLCYGVTAAFVAIAWWGVQRQSPQFWLVAALGAGLLTASALTLGSLRPKIEESPPHIPAREVRKGAAGFD